DVEIDIHLSRRGRSVGSDGGRRRRHAIPIHLQARLEQHVDVQVEIRRGGDLYRPGKRREKQHGKRQWADPALGKPHGSILSAPPSDGELLCRRGRGGGLPSSWSSARRASSSKVFHTCSRNSTKSGKESVSRVRGRGRSTCTTSATVLGRPLRT